MGMIVEPDSHEELLRRQGKYKIINFRLISEAGKYYNRDVMIYNHVD